MKINIDEITLKVYRSRLETDSGEGAADRQVAEHGEEKQKRWSLIYRPTVIETLVQVGLYERPLPPRQVKKSEHEENDQPQ